jgi:hypothetical protein
MVSVFQGQKGPSPPCFAGNLNYAPCDVALSWSQCVVLLWYNTKQYINTVYIYIHMCLFVPRIFFV